MSPVFFFCVTLASAEVHTFGKAIIKNFIFHFAVLSLNRNFAADL